MIIELILNFQNKENIDPNQDQLLLSPPQEKEHYPRLASNNALLPLQEHNLNYDSDSSDVTDLSSLSEYIPSDTEN